MNSVFCHKLYNEKNERERKKEQEIKIEEHSAHIKTSLKLTPKSKIYLYTKRFGLKWIFSKGSQQDDNWIILSSLKFVKNCITHC